MWKRKYIYFVNLKVMWAPQANFFTILGYFCAILQESYQLPGNLRIIPEAASPAIYIIYILQN